ncbi:metallophosphoesterase family protein [Erythrobacter rubeus]|uniref:Metallophosphoesterase n=1 Tax=Erythrobacter rubeus TaxID=2760803 RepID=A0ABR8KQZ7_9SPHN|nr:metallophosphoesterase [Erythrobacter rubeus]MBD2843182.1 metallophosphoesterase [Erythrobacter rubeus]
MATRLFHISDVHFGVEDPGAIAAVERAVEEERPDVILCTGDLTQRATKLQYAEAAAWFEGLKVPVLFDPGNHDMPYYNLLERFTDPYRRYRGLVEAAGGAFESEDVVFVPLKTTVRAQPRFPWSDGFVTDKALALTIALLRELDGDPRTIIVTAHHPLLGPKDDENPTIGGDKAFSAIAATGAHAIVTGHVHVPFDEVRERGGHSLRMLGTGTLSTRLRNGAPPSYRVITCEQGGRIETELRTLTPADS